MEAKQVGGGLLAIVAVAVQVVTQAMGLKIPQPLGYAVLAVCIALFGLGIALIFAKPRAGPGAPSRDVGLAEALAYAACREWGIRPMDVPEGTLSEVGDSWQQTRQHAVDGRLRIWGKRSPTSAFEVIAPEFWITHQADWFSVLRAAAHTEPATHRASSDRFEELMVSKAEIESLYPQRK